MADPEAVGRAIDNTHLSKIQIRVLILCALTGFFKGVGVQLMALSVPNISEDW